MSAILKFDFQNKKKTITSFRKKIIQATQKRHNFACDIYIFPKIRTNKNKQWTHYSALKTLKSAKEIMFDLLEELQPGNNQNVDCYLYFQILSLFTKTLTPYTTYKFEKTSLNSTSLWFSSYKYKPL